MCSFPTLPKPSSRTPRRGVPTAAAILRQNIDENQPATPATLATLNARSGREKGRLKGANRKLETKCLCKPLQFTDVTKLPVYNHANEQVCSHFLNFCSPFAPAHVWRTWQSVSA